MMCIGIGMSMVCIGIGLSTLCIVQYSGQCDSVIMVVLEHLCAVFGSVFQTEDWSVLVGEVGGCWVRWEDAG